MNEQDIRHERIEREARRVAAAFGVKECPPIPTSVDRNHFFEAYVGEDWIEWNVGDGHSGNFFVIIGLPNSEYEHSSFSANRAFKPLGKPHPHYNAQMVRGLYCLGIDDQETVSQFNYPLSTHEKLELRLSMPREFWPQKWFDEDIEPNPERTSD